MVNAGPRRFVPSWPTEAEYRALQDLLWGGYPFAYVLYLQEIRRHVDRSTGVAGRVRRFSEQGFKETLERDPKRGPKGTGKSRSRQFLQRQISALEKYGLVERLKKQNRFERMVYYLPLAVDDEIRLDEMRTVKRAVMRTEKTPKLVDVSAGYKSNSNSNADSNADNIPILEEEEGKSSSGGYSFEQLQAVDLEMVVALYHEILGKVAPRLRAWDCPAYRLMVARVWYMGERYQQEKFWRGYFALVSKNDFLRGRVPSTRGRPFQVNFKFLLNPENTTKILNGEYV